MFYMWKNTWRRQSFGAASTYEQTPEEGSLLELLLHMNKHLKKAVFWSCFYMWTNTWRRQSFGAASTCERTPEEGKSFGTASTCGQTPAEGKSFGAASTCEQTPEESRSLELIRIHVYLVCFISYRVSKRCCFCWIYVLGTLVLLDGQLECKLYCIIYR